MSRVGKKPIQIPEGVQVTLERDLIKIKGPKGELSQRVLPGIKIEIKEGQILVLSKVQNKNQKALWGTVRALLFNKINGVLQSYEKKLEIEGLGYKAQLEGSDLVLFCGFTHPVKIKAPEAIKFSLDKNIITIAGIDKELVGKMAAKIRKVRPAEPYKGKGIKYLGEVIRRKAGKKVTSTTGQ